MPEQLSLVLPEEITPGMVLVATERARQITAEGYAPEHDAGHTGAELAWAAYCYAYRALTADDPTQVGDSEPPVMWPWGYAEWKPGRTALRSLVKAAALLTAEVDRRLAAGEQP